MMPASPGDYEIKQSNFMAGKKITTGQKVLPLILDDLPDEMIPMLVSGYKYERYADPVGYRNILKLLKKTSTSR